MSLRGKGFMIINIQDCEGGDPRLIARQAQACGLKHIAVKIADGPWRWNFLRCGQDLVPDLVTELHKQGIHVWGWHLIYGYQPLIEANIAVRRLMELPGLDGYIIDAGASFIGHTDLADDFMLQVKNSLPNTPIALCSFRYPQANPNFPWNTFLSRCSWYMPQIYWLGSGNAGNQMRTSIAQFNQMEHKQSIMPVGTAFEEAVFERGRKRWYKPTSGDVQDFLNTAVQMNLPAVSFYSWDWCRSRLPDVWDAIASFQWPGIEQPRDIRDRLLTALNTQDTHSLSNLYQPDALYITPEGPVYGLEQIQQRYQAFFREKLPGAKYNITAHNGVGNMVHFTWEAQSSLARIQNAADSLYLVDGKIGCHYSHFTVSA